MVLNYNNTNGIAVKISYVVCDFKNVKQKQTNLTRPEFYPSSYRVHILYSRSVEQERRFMAILIL